MAKRKVNKRRIRSEKIEVPMSALIDVVFLLLIYFIMTYKSNKPEAHLALNLPSPSKEVSEEKPQLTEIWIVRHAEGNYLMMGVSRATIDVLEETWLENLAATDPAQTIIIKVDPSAWEVDLVTLLDRCAKLQLTGINVMTLKDANPPQ